MFYENTKRDNGKNTGFGEWGTSKFHEALQTIRLELSYGEKMPRADRIRSEQRKQDRSHERWLQGNN